MRWRLLRCRDAPVPRANRVPPVVIAADLVPWWFAAAFWVAFAVLVVVVVRDVRRAGGLRRTWLALQDAAERRARGHERGDVTDAERSGDAGPLTEAEGQEGDPGR